MRRRLAAVISYGVSFFHTTAVRVALLALGLAVGAYVRSWWMLLSLLGPLIALGYLEVSGFVGTSDDWASEPLLSPPGVFVFFIFTMILMIGRALAEGAEWVAEFRRRRRF